VPWVNPRSTLLLSSPGTTTQREMNACFEGAEFYYALNMAQILFLVILATAFSSALPLALPLCAAYLLLRYATERVYFVSSSINIIYIYDFVWYCHSFSCICFIPRCRLCCPLRACLLLRYATERVYFVSSSIYVEFVYFLRFLLFCVVYFLPFLLCIILCCIYSCLRCRWRCHSVRLTCSCDTPQSESIL